MQEQKKRPAGPTVPEKDTTNKIPPTMIDTSELEDKLKKAEKANQPAQKRRPCCCC